MEDNIDAAKMLQLARQLEGHTVRLALNREAVADAAAFRPDIIVLDIGLPRMNGYEVATGAPAGSNDVYPGAVLAGGVGDTRGTLALESKAKDPTRAWTRCALTGTSKPTRAVPRRRPEMT